LDTKENLFDYNQSFTIGFNVFVENIKGTDPVIFSNKDWRSGDNNGFLFMVKNNKILLNSKSVSDSGRLNGYSDLTVANFDVRNKWVHIAAVYDKEGGINGTVTYYANGIKVDTKNTDLTEGIGGSQLSYIAQSMASGNYGPLYNGENKDYDVTFRMENFLLQAGTMTDEEIAHIAKN
jgi:hypothetical protein